MFIVKIFFIKEVLRYAKRECIHFNYLAMVCTSLNASKIFVILMKFQIILSLLMLNLPKNFIQLALNLSFKILIIYWLTLIR